MLVKISPLDTLFFRTGRPFAKGEDTWSDTVFPPFPSTLYGAIRSFMIFRRGSLKEFYEGRWKYDLGTPCSKGKLEIKGPLLFNGEIQFNAPKDLVALKKIKNNELYRLKLLQRIELWVSNYNLEGILIWQKKDMVDEPKGYLSIYELIEYLKNEKESFKAIDYKELFCEEPKIGIEINNVTLTANEGSLYRIPLIRLKEGVGLVLEVDGIGDLPHRGVLHLGGESKGAYFERIEDPLDDLKELSFNFSNRLFKVYLATPAIFENGWLPRWIEYNGNNYIGDFNGIRVKLIACALGKPINIGGWDMKRGTPKPLRKAVPAGSVYYFELLDNTKSEKLKETFHLKSISDINPEEGFGLSIIGEVKL